VSQTFTQFIRYNLVGIVNTLFGFSIIFSLMFVGISATISNAIGYALGAVLSYYLNAKYTFKSTKSRQQAIKFFTILAIAYLLNFATLTLLLNYLNPYIAQLIAAIVYTLSSFLMAKTIAFREE